MNTLKSAMIGLKKGLLIVFNKLGITLLIMCFITSGCALIKLKKENTESLSSTVLVGRISTAFPGKGPIIVAAYSMNQGIGKKNAETVIDLSANDNGRILGPFPTGDYLATFSALTAFGKRYVPVTIENNQTSELNYVLTPDNVICGTLTSALQSKDWAAGMPYEENFTIQSITLKGTGIHRKPHLLVGEDVNIFDYTIPRTDFYSKGNFVFYGVPPGEYELIIRAQGYKPFVKKCFIKGGVQLDPLLVELTLE